MYRAILVYMYNNNTSWCHGVLPGQAEANIGRHPGEALLNLEMNSLQLNINKNSYLFTDANNKSCDVFSEVLKLRNYRASKC